ncbi:hypothetical protein AB0E96_04125 [Kitasatospora sp. NPDC036755]|uniref:hypothetical protein n=1 Tax=Kitasatospora sp. NPDC036755 TaxID=3154600 RepID=UPI0033C5E340
MPRRRPAGLRTDHRHEPRTWDDPPPARIPRLSTRAGPATHRVEQLSTDYCVHPGATDRAPRRHRAFTLPTGRRPRYPQGAHGSCRGCSFDDVRHARDVLDQLLRELPARAREEPGRRVAVPEAACLRRTPPDPFADRRQRRPDPWWRRRLADGREGT